MSNNLNIDNSWEIIEHFTDPKNEDLLHALVNGVNSLSIEFREPLNEKETGAIFEGIHLDFIELYLHGHEDTIRIAEKLTNKFQSHEIYTFKNQSFKQELSDFLSKSKDYLSTAVIKTPPRIYFHVNDHFLANIAKIRAIRILWNHLLLSFNMVETPLKIIVIAGHYKENTQIEEDYIHASIQLMSSLISSADGVQIQIPEKMRKSHSFKARIARNLHHLAAQEARMGLVHDPMKGSYFIEEKSNAYAENAWNKLIA